MPTGAEQRRNLLWNAVSLADEGKVEEINVDAGVSPLIARRTWFNCRSCGLA